MTVVQLHGRQWRLARVFLWRPFVLKFLVTRLLGLVPTLLGVTLLAFALIHLLPGDPVDVMMGEHVADPAAHAAALHQLGLDEPLPTQYLRYLQRLLHADLGHSFKSGRSVIHDFGVRFPATLELSICAIAFALVLVLGLAAGTAAALRRGSWLDHAVMSTALTGYSMPIFWWGLVLIMLFSVKLGWTPVSGRIGLEFDLAPVTNLMLVDSVLSRDPATIGSVLRHLILPTVVLGTIPLAVVARMTRSSILEVLREDYIRTANAKGLTPARVIVVHVLRNALIPVVTAVGMQVGGLLGAVLVVAVNLLVDVASRLINPRLVNSR